MGDEGICLVLIFSLVFKRMFFDLYFLSWQGRINMDFILIMNEIRVKVFRFRQDGVFVLAWQVGWSIVLGFRESGVEEVMVLIIVLFWVWFIVILMFGFLQIRIIKRERNSSLLGWERERLGSSWRGRFCRLILSAKFRGYRGGFLYSRRFWEFGFEIRFCYFRVVCYFF